MELFIAPGDILQIDNARICFRNFRGEGDMYNPKGARNFALIIDTVEDYEKIRELGYNVKAKPANDEGETDFMFLPVKLNYNYKGGPNAYLVTSSNRVELDEETIGVIDEIDIIRVDLDIRPHDWELPNGKCGRSAQLKSIRVVQAPPDDRFASMDE